GRGDDHDQAAFHFVGSVDELPEHFVDVYHGGGGMEQQTIRLAEAAFEAVSGNIQGQHGAARSDEFQPVGQGEKHVAREVAADLLKDARRLEHGDGFQFPAQPGLNALDLGYLRLDYFQIRLAEAEHGGAELMHHGIVVLDMLV